MSTSHGRAPGKLVWLGEYAVLDGAPAIVCAVDRFAHAHLTEADNGVWLIDGTNLGVATQIWPDPDASGPLALITRLLDALARDGLLEGLPAYRCTLDSREFFSAGAKLGIGSSAAITSALCFALDAVRGVVPATSEVFARLALVHAQHQDGRGSGVDIAAALHGGMLRFTRAMDDTPAQWQRLELPGDLHWRAVYTGAGTSTAHYLGRIDAWRQRQPRAYAAHVEELTALASSGADALAAGRSDQLCSVMDRYATALHGLGRAADVDIVSAAHQGLARLAARHGVAYKPSGAGGRDLGLAAGVDPVALDAFCAAAGACAGITPLTLRMAPARG